MVRFATEKIKDMVRTCSEICIDADNNSEDLFALTALWSEVVKNKYFYPLVEIEFMREHLSGHAKNLARKHAQTLRYLIY